MNRLFSIIQQNMYGAGGAGGQMVTQSPPYAGPPSHRAINLPHNPHLIGKTILYEYHVFSGVSKLSKITYVLIQGTTYIGQIGLTPSCFYQKNKMALACRHLVFPYKNKLGQIGSVAILFCTKKELPVFLYVKLYTYIFFCSNCYNLISDLAGSREQRGSAFELYRKPQHMHNLR